MIERCFEKSETTPLQYTCMVLKRWDEHCSRYNLELLYIIPLLQNFKNLPKKLCDRQTKHKPYCLYTIEEPQIISKRLKERSKGRCIYHFTYTIIPKFQKYAKKSKLVRSSKKAQAMLLISYFMPV